MDSFISWIGGKRLLRKRIMSLFPSDFDRYVEVFGGAGWVLFGADRHAPVEVYNDYDGDLVNLFRCVKCHPQELRRELAYTLNSREVFSTYRKQMTAEGLTDIQRAARYFMIIKLSYGSDRRTYGCKHSNITRMVDYLSKAHERLSSVVIEHRSYKDIIQRYDRPDALLYLDPPYHGTEKYYDCGFGEDDHLQLHKLLSNAQGKFILSYNDDAFVRDLYKDFEVIPAVRNSNLVARYEAADKQYRELIIKNF